MLQYLLLAGSAMAAVENVQLCFFNKEILSEWATNLYSDVIRNNSNEKFTYDTTTNLLQVESNNQCVGAWYNQGAFTVHTVPCDANDSSQKWQIDLTHHRLRHSSINNACLGTIPAEAGHPVYVTICQDESMNQWIDYCSNVQTHNYVLIRSRIFMTTLSEYDTGLYADNPRYNLNEIFDYDVNNKMLKAMSNGQCLDCFLDTQGNGHIHTYPCDPNNPNQKWNVFASDYRIQHATHTNLCLDADPNDNQHRAQPGMTDTTSSQAIPSGYLSSLIVFVLVICSLMCLPLLLYHCNRHTPSIRYRKPNLMSIAALWSSIYSISRCAIELNPSKINCTAMMLVFGVSLQTTLMAYFLAELSVVLTFNLTELMIRYNEQHITHNGALSKLQYLLRNRHLAIAWIITQLVWNSPLFIVIYTGPDYTMYDGNNCPLELRNKLVPLSIIQYSLIGIAAMRLSYSLSKVVDNFGLQKAFQHCGRAMCLVLLCYLPFSILYDNAFVMDSHLEFFIAAFGGQLIHFFHIIGPVRQVFKEKTFDQNVFKGTEGILEAFLSTDAGFQAFTEFAKGEYEYEAVVAWKAIADFKAEANDCLTASEIYQTHICLHAPLSLRRFVPAELLGRYETAYEGNTKYGIHPDVAHDSDSFNLILAELMVYLVHSTLPRFQVHPLGAAWKPFVEQYQTRKALDLVLLKQQTHEREMVKYAVLPRKLEPIQSMGNFTETSTKESRRKTRLQTFERGFSAPDKLRELGP